MYLVFICYYVSNIIPYQSIDKFAIDRELVFKA